MRRLVGSNVSCIKITDAGFPFIRGHYGRTYGIFEGPIGHCAPLQWPFGRTTEFPPYFGGHCD